MAAGVSWWLAQPSGPVEPRPTGVTSVGYYLKNASIVQMDETGRPLYEVRAEQILEDTRDNSVALERVRVDYAFEGSSWSLEADRGRITNGYERIDLEGEVRATGLQAGKGDKAVIHTPSLQLDVRDYVASTAEQVKIELGGHEIFSKGARAYLKENRLELQSEVHGRFTPR